MEDTLTDKLISILKDRDLPVKQEVVESFEDDRNVQWASKHLRPDTLLSKDELALYLKLESSGALQPILNNPDFGATRPVLEDELRDAIESLEASTAAILKQTETLKFQCASINKQLGLENNIEQQRSRDIARLHKKHEAGRHTTTMAATELADELEAGFRSATDKSGAESKRILASLSTRLKQDDKALASLETLMSSIKYRGNDASTVKRTSHLSALLSDYVAEEIHYRLDRLYLETIHAGGSSSDAMDGTMSTALEEELESLYPEIEILAEISTRQQFQEPILRELQNEHDKLRMASQEKLEQALDMLIEMTLSKQDLTNQLGVRESSSELLEQLAALYQSEAGSELVTQPSSRRESLRRRSLQPGLLLARTATAPVVAQPSLERLLRRVGIPPESILHPREDGGVDDLHEKRYDISETLHNLNIGVNAPLMTCLAPLDNASQLLRCSLHANSHYETSLRDPSEVLALSGLEKELMSLQNGVQKLNLDVLHQRDSNQDRLVERWT
ncbi:hypothetical protein N7489_009428 [Penicillium chrysogenum]|uniref:HAUS augmin-like complex subunit n=1 Tax=Penicillium chrysogenum TaxID=5076 RepID=A0ABQ8WX82_PENCH|nr:uncharacterized protein N7489_009428 [Penicillium chrysogenum]KAJ5228720.1 hypothetical protein N7489_009428 [Penicillium chrysogenum]KAJ5258121.1 hypothetical protein N7524_009677 [Penicillium chrysogenum]KAJ5283647.1 hypothetical protein N7505_001627 [Penicillium chrysogenum]KAJ6168549.1 hypothetical protein N7497_001392 [Penicillium chrysogenum]